MQGITKEELQLMLAAGLLRPTRRTADGRVTEYELTHEGRIFLARGEVNETQLSAPAAAS